MYYIESLGPHAAYFDRAVNRWTRHEDFADSSTGVLTWMQSIVGES